MIPLDSPKWKDLKQAYGSAENIPALLRALSAPGSAVEQKKVWHEIWSCLCHQTDVYDGTYAAIPHFLAILKTKEGRERAAFYHFIGYSFMCANMPDAVTFPIELAHEVKQSVTETLSLLLADLKLEWPNNELRMLTSMLLALKGDFAGSSLLLNWESLEKDCIVEAVDPFEMTR